MLQSFDLIGNRSVSSEAGGGGDGDFLSDHFGLMVRIDVSNHKNSKVE